LFHVLLSVAGIISGFVVAFGLLTAKRKALAPTQSEPAFKMTQFVVLAIFVVLGVFATLRFRNEQLRTT
jgi:hypothetical protein